MAITDLAYIDSTGYHYSDYPSFLAYIQQQYQTIYGSDVYLGADSQDGQFLAILAKAFFDTAALGASVFNSFSPSTAQGVGLSRVVKINGLKRGVPTNSQVDVTITGQAGTIILNGIIEDTLSQKWDLPASVTIPGGGTITVTATAELLGDITADSGTVNKIFTPTLGWQSVTNTLAATPGAPIETDAALRARQSRSTADPSLTVFDGTIGGVSNLTGVTKVQGYENDTDDTDSNMLPPHSVCLVVLGGDDMDIANEIALHKTPGTNAYADPSDPGYVAETVYDSHGMPLLIRFLRPTSATIGVQITGGATPAYSTDFIPLIQQAVADQINSGNIGATVLYTKLFQPAYLNGAPAGQTYTIASLEINKNGGGFIAGDKTLNFNENAVCNPSDVSVSIS